MKLKINKIICDTTILKETEYIEYITERENTRYLKKEIPIDINKHILINKTYANQQKSRNNQPKSINTVNKNVPKANKKLKEHLNIGYETFTCHKSYG